jgi:Zn-dependent protease with chaperone function
MTERENPTKSIDVSFASYVDKRKALSKLHTEAGIPDYAYGADYAMRQKIRAIPGVFALFKAITNQIVPLMKQEINLTGLKVGSSQFSDVYDMTVDCARILGIGIPSVFIINNPEVNAFTYALEDEEPLIVIHSGLLERLKPGELKAVIGHECGHIHNSHGIYEIAARAILGTLSVTVPFVGQILKLISLPLELGLMAWNRAAEVTSDRAGVICCDDPHDALMVDAKLAYGAAFNRDEVNIDAIIKQYDALRSTPVRLLEFISTHPVSVRRILAAQVFLESAVLYSWRPEWKKPDMNLIGKQELDARCDKFVSVMKSRKRR